MGDVVDEMIVNLSEGFVRENNVNGENKGNEEKEGKDDGWNDKVEGSEYVIMECGEENIEKRDVGRRMFLKEERRIDFLMVM